MWVAFLVVMLMTPAGAQLGVQAAPEPFHTKQECEAANAQVEKAVNESPEVKGYVFKCVEIKKEDVKVNGKDS